MSILTDRLAYILIATKDWDIDISPLGKLEVRMDTPMSVSNVRKQRFKVGQNKILSEIFIFAAYERVKHHTVDNLCF
jgi:hypothetical protein